MDQSGRAVELLSGILGGELLGVYLHGSSVVGSLRPGSDLDLLAVTRRRTVAQERGELIEGLMAISRPAGTRGASDTRDRCVELTIVAKPDVSPWHFPPRQDLLYGEWWRAEFEAGNFSPWISLNPDLTIALEMVLQANRPLLGPPPAELLGPIPWGDVRRGMLESIPALLSYLDGDERNVVLTFVRIWTTLATGEIRSKDAAADWALPQLPPEHRPVLERARELYVTGEPELWGSLMAGIRPCVNYLIQRIEEEASR